MERTLGSKILWMKVPAVKSVMKAIRSRIVASVVASLPDEEIAPALTADGVPLDTPLETPIIAEDAAKAAQTDSGLTAEAPAIPAVTETAAPPDAIDSPGAVIDSPDAVSPFLAKVCRQLIERLGAERAVEALVSLSYGELLDPSRYGTVTEFSEESFRDIGKFHDTGRGRFAPGRGSGTRPERSSGHHGEERGGFRPGPKGSARGSGAYGGGTRPHSSSGPRGGVGGEGGSRVYVGLGRHHGASARDVAELLIKAGGVPGRLVDAIEMKEFCAFATLPEEAARRACSFSRSAPGNPVIRPASPVRE
jgi:ATP-dependent RNA helicase DeaD